MFEVKKYVWLLSELSKQKANLKILDIYFLKLESIQTSFLFSAEGFIFQQSNKQWSIKETLEKLFSKKLSSSETSDLSKPIIYVCYPTYKKILSLNDLKDLFKKDQKLTSVKEIVLMQDYQHSPSQYYSVELEFDGEGLVSSVYRKDFSFPESSWNDHKYIHLAMNLSKYLVSFIESVTLKNVLRLNYDFVIDPSFTPIILLVTSIKLVSPKIIALNKGLGVEVLERHIPIKNDFKTLVFPLVLSIVKEPEPEATSPSPIGSNLTTSIFKHFIKKFLEGKPRKKTVKLPLSEQVTPLPRSDKRINDELKTQSNRNSHGRSTALPFDRLRLNLSHGDSNKLPDVRNMPSPKIISHRSIFECLKPSNSLTKFLRDEEERILQRKTKRLACVKIFEDLGNEVKKKGKKPGIIIKRKSRKPKTREKITSPYLKVQVFK